MEKLRTPGRHRDGGADQRVVDDTNRDVAAWDGHGSVSWLDAGGVDRPDGSSPPKADAIGDAPIRPSVDGPSDDANAGARDGVQEDASAIDLAFDAPVGTAIDLAPGDSADDLSDKPDEPFDPGSPPDAPVDVLPGRDLGIDLPAQTLPCPSTITGMIESSDWVQIGRHSRVAPASTCGTAKAYPGNSADSSYAHLYDLHRFHNASGSPVCFTFTLTYPGAQLYAAAYSQFTPANIATGYLGDVGASLESPQTMGISVAGGSSIEVVVYAVAIGSASAGSYTLTCSTP